MSLWTTIRDLGESAASVAGNYLLPGSGFITSNLVSSGAQDQLGSPLGQLAMLGSGLTGAGFGEGTTGIPSASNLGYGWGNAFGALGFGSGAINAPEAGFSPTGGLGMSEQDIMRQLGNEPETAFTRGLGTPVTTAIFRLPRKVRPSLAVQVRSVV